jgi:hypothetical protein
LDWSDVDFDAEQLEVIKTCIKDLLSIKNITFYGKKLGNIAKPQRSKREFAPEPRIG